MLNEKAKNTIMEVQKSQMIRLADVFIIAPYLLYVSSKRKLSEFDRNMIFGIGVATLVYNAFNYFENNKKKKDG